MIVIHSSNTSLIHGQYYMYVSPGVDDLSIGTYTMKAPLASFLSVVAGLFKVALCFKLGSIYCIMKSRENSN